MSLYDVRKTNKRTDLEFDIKVTHEDLLDTICNVEPDETPFFHRQATGVVHEWLTDTLRPRPWYKNLNIKGRIYYWRMRLYSTWKVLIGDWYGVKHGLNSSRYSIHIDPAFDEESEE